MNWATTDIYHDLFDSVVPIQMYVILKRQRRTIFRAPQNDADFTHFCCENPVILKVKARFIDVTTAT